MTNKINKCDGNHGGPRCADPECWNDAPVPPAGGDVEGYKYRLKGRVNRAWTYAKDKPEQFTDEFDVVPLYSGDIVTRLQAEAERLEEQACISGKNMLDQWNRANALQSKLTKARELLEHMLKDDDMPVHWFAQRIDDFLSNQSAPADKGQGGPVHISGSFSDGPRAGIHAVKCVDDFSYSAQQRPAPTAKDHGEQSAFESWAQDDDRFGTSRTRSSGDYDEPDTQVAWDAWRARARMTEQPSPITGYTAVDMSTAAAQGFRDGQAAAVVMPEKYDDVLLPFLSLMRAELHANAHKGDRPGWLQMDRKTAVLEVFYHMGKLHQAVHRDEAEAIKEYAADVANMCMMLTDVCGCLDSEPKP